MIDALIAGKLHGNPIERTSKAGKAFCVAKVRVATGEGESLFVSVIAFSESACTALLALNDGDAVALAGTLTPKVWTNSQGEAKPAIDMVAAQVLSAYHVQRKRRAMERPAGGDRPHAPKTTTEPAGAAVAGRPDPDFDGDLDF